MKHQHLNKEQKKCSTYTYFRQLAVMVNDQK